MSQTQKAIFKGTIPTTTTQYVGVPIDRAYSGGSLGVHIGWKDATSAATITLELSSFPLEDVPVDEAGDAWEWLDSGETITGPTGAAAGCSQVNVQNARQRRARLKIVTTAICDFEIHDGGA